MLFFPNTVLSSGLIVVVICFALKQNEYFNQKKTLIENDFCLD